MSATDCFIVFSPLLALVTFMLIGFGYVHFVDNRP